MIESGKKRVLFVCDYGSVHARQYIDYFLNAGSLRITVLNTGAPITSSRVEVLNLPRRESSGLTGRKSRVAEWIYERLLQSPSVLNRLWAWRLGRHTTAMREAAAAIGILDEIDIVHAMRLQPEAIIAAAMVARRPGIPLVASSWGQDLILFARRDRHLGRLTRKALSRVDLLIADNARDERLAREEWGLRKEAMSIVMPATGGLRLPEMHEGGEDHIDLPIRGSPSLLTARGFESGYNRLLDVLRAFQVFLRSHPAAHLYVAIPRDGRRMRMLQRWIDNANLSNSSTLITPDRSDLLSYMAACDINVFSTLSDGLSMSMLESLYQGQIQVVPQHESFVPPLVNMEDAVLFPVSAKPQEIAAALKAATQIPTTRADRIRRVRARLQSAYLQDANLVKVGVAYTMLLESSDKRLDCANHGEK